MLSHSFVATAAFACVGSSSDAAHARAQMMQVSVGVLAAQMFAIILANAAQPLASSVLPEWLCLLGSNTVALKGAVVLSGCGAVLWIVGLWAYNQITTGRSRGVATACSCQDSWEHACSAALGVLSFAAWAVAEVILAGLSHQSRGSCFGAGM